MRDTQRAEPVSAVGYDTRVLVVDDDKQDRGRLSDFLEAKGLAVAQAGDGIGMWRALNAEAVDIVILDVGLPGTDGLELCRRLRAGSGIPIILLTARSSPIERIRGLESGADDYLCKPFEPLELYLRIRGLLRRATPGDARPATERTAARLRFGNWTLDLKARQLVTAAGGSVALSGAEFRLLSLFLEQPNRVLSRDQVMHRIRGRNASPFDRSIDLQVSRLRHKIEDDSRHPKIIKTIRNEGYVLTVPVKVEPSE